MCLLCYNVIVYICQKRAHDPSMLIGDFYCQASITFKAMSGYICDIVKNHGNFLDWGVSKTSFVCGPLSYKVRRFMQTAY